MNYRKHYIKLIRKAQTDPILFDDTYTEKHHIFPISVFGKNNIVVKLTAKEHFVAHLLLWKDFRKRYGNKNLKTKKMLHAIFLMMASDNNKKNNSRKFSKLREEYSESSKGLNNSFYGKTHSEKTKQKMSKNHFDVSGKNNPNYGNIGEKNPAYKGKLEAINLKTFEHLFFKDRQEATLSGFNKEEISRCCNNTINSYRGYKWFYISKVIKNEQ